jgi:hypothetical protein
MSGMSASAAVADIALLSKYPQQKKGDLDKIVDRLSFGAWKQATEITVPGCPAAESPLRAP